MATISAVPPVLDLTLYAGDDITIQLTVLADNNLPYDLTGSLLAQIRKGHDLEVVATFTTSAPDPTSGIVWLTLDHTQTEALGDLGGHHSWDLQLTNPSNIVTTLCRGSCSTQLDITEVGP